MTDIDTRSLRDACGAFATGVTVISTRSAEGDHGMTANAFMSVSLDPPLISISLDRKCKMLERVREAGRYAVNILSSEMQPIALHFAGKHDPAFADIFEERHGFPVLGGASAFLLTEVVQEIEAGDHSLFIGRVRHLERDPAASPLLFCGGQFGELAPASMETRP
ncbi:flavin reductase family protein [Roseibium sp.]|uniref:flavin reductase family protein n=1 Tax=Roseibium sp. TaxID=1936156 RepID=UPI003A96A58C